MEDIEIYIQKDREERRSHLRLSEACIEIGGNSTAFKGLLAHFLRTTIAKRRTIYLCHACHNPKCSNPLHLYWGTPIDNSIDSQDNPKNDKAQVVARRVQTTKRLHGEDFFKRISSKASRMGKKLKPDQNLLLRYKEALAESCYPKRGWKSQVAVNLGVSHTQISRYYEKYLK